jgi:hypothetical protein
MFAQRHVIAVAQLDNPGNPYEIDASLEVETADDRRPGNDENLELRKRLRQRVRDGTAAADMAQPETVVAIDENATWRRGNG